MIYGVRFEDGPDGVGAYLPDVPGIGVVGDDRDEALAMIDKALQWHFDALIEDGMPLPQPTVNTESYSCFVTAHPLNPTQ